MICIYHNLFNHKSINCHLDCFHLLASMNSVYMNVQMQVLFGYLLSIILGITLGVELLSHALILCLLFEESTNYFPFYITTKNEWRFLLHILASNVIFWFVCLFIIAYLTGMKWYLIGPLICIYLMTSVIKHPFYMLVHHLYISFGELFTQVSIIFNYIIDNVF